MKRLSTLALVAACLLPLAAADASAQSLVAGDAWIRATVAGQKVTALYLRLESAAPATLIAISVPPSVAGDTEIHETLRDQDIARMQRVERVAIAAGERVEFRPGGYHVMLLGLKQPLKAGDRLPVTLRLVQDGKPRELVVTATVRPIGGGSEHSTHQHHEK